MILSMMGRTGYVAVNPRAMKIAGLQWKPDCGYAQLTMMRFANRRFTR